MPGVFELLIIIIVFGSIFIAPLAIGAWLIVKLVTGGRGERTERIDESRAIQELHQGLAKMEERIESLETILLERGKKGDRI